jgi:hypothetical protein
MTTTTEPQRSPRDVFLTVPEVFERYRWKRSRAYLMLDEPGFPARIGNGYRLDTLCAWEDSLLERQTIRETPQPVQPSGAAPVTRPASKRKPRAAVEPIAIPEKQRPGRKAA